MSFRETRNESKRRLPAEEEWTTQHIRDDYDEDNALQDSEMTQPTDGSVSEDDAGGWLGSISTDFRNMATCFKDSTLPVIGGMASLIHKTVVTVAEEIAQLERDGELPEAEFDAGVESLSLPWEIQQDSENSTIPVFVTDGELMDAILALSRQKSTFSSPFVATSVDRKPGEEDAFVLDQPHVALIRRLLDADEHLAAVHDRLPGKTFLVCESATATIIGESRVLSLALDSWFYLGSGRSDIYEIVFWRNYFHHCEITRKEHLEKRLLREEKHHNPSSGMLTALSMLDEGMDANCPDDSSLIPASVTDDASYVIYPSPCSNDTLTTTRSIEDMVLVGRETDCEYDDN